MTGRHRNVSLVLVMLLLAVSAGCAGGRSAASVPANRSLISYEELAQFDPRTTVRDAIRRLRPAWLQVRGSATLRGSVPVVVYLNGQRRNDAMDRYTVTEVSEIRHLNGIEATQRFGTDHGSGAVLISLR